MSYDPNYPYSGYGAQPEQPQPPPSYEPTQYVGPTAHHPYEPPTVPQYPLPQYPLPQYPLPQQQYAMFPPPPPRPRSSLRWLWITLGILAGVTVLSCGSCLLALNAMGAFAGLNKADLNGTVNNYYTAIEKQDYATAYSYLDMQTFTVGAQQVPATEAAYVQLAQSIDEESGPLTSYAIEDSTNEGNAATVMLSATRTEVPVYYVTLQLEQINGSWKITDFDSI